MASAVAKLKQELPGDILVAGSRTLVNSLERNALVDEYRLMVFPLVLGSGMRLFEETTDATRLELTNVEKLDSGAVILTYQRIVAANEAVMRDRVASYCLS
jgi:dihydrofolate reductase